ncbi:MAG: PAS domain-containing sensor histidine kinase [Pseudomonadota bacterium]
MTSSDQSPAARPAAPRDIRRTLDLLPDGADVDERVLAAAFLASPYASFILDADGQILVCSRRAERLYACAADLRGTHLSELSDLDSADMGTALREGAARGRTAFHMVSAKRLRAMAHTVFHVALLRSAETGAPLYLLTQDSLAATAEALSVMNTRRMQARNELNEIEGQNSALHQSMVAMEAFAHTASHDLRTPLNTLSGLLELFSSKFGDELPDKGREYLDYMTRAVVQMDTMTTDFLHHARSAAGALEARPVAMRTFLEELLRDLSETLRAVDATVEVLGPDIEIMAEPALLRMLMMNLLTNALKHKHADRTPAIRINLCPPADDAGYPILRVSDNGLGFEPTQRTAIFKAFHRLNPNVTGTGVGLATCKEVCRRHGWEISASAEVDKGAVFEVLFVSMRVACDTTRQN